MNKVIIIAEAGVNHNGDIQVAKKLIDELISGAVSESTTIKLQRIKNYL